MAWCSPPDILKATSASSDSSISTARSDAPVDHRAASYIPV